MAVLETRILALDPGVTSGWAAARITGRTLHSLESGQDKFGANDLWRFLDRNRPNYIVCETFRYRNAARGGLDLTPVKWIGICELYEQRYFDCELKFQEPSEGAGFWSNEKLKQAELYVSARGDHRNWAMRHLVYFLTFKKGSTLWHETDNHFLSRYAQ